MASKKEIKTQIEEIKKKLDIVTDELEKGDLQNQLDDLESKLDTKLSIVKKIIAVCISGATLVSVILGIVLSVL